MRYRIKSVCYFARNDQCCGRDLARPLIRVCYAKQACLMQIVTCFANRIAYNGKFKVVSLTGSGCNVVRTMISAVAGIGTTIVTLRACNGQCCGIILARPLIHACYAKTNMLNANRYAFR